MIEEASGLADNPSCIRSTFDSLVRRNKNVWKDTDQANLRATDTMLIPRLTKNYGACHRQAILQVFLGLSLPTLAG